MLCAPFVALAFTTALVGYFADVAVRKGTHITLVRKICMCAAELVQFIGFMVLGYVRSSYWASEVCVFLITAIGETARGTISTNTLDISGPYGGLVIALSNTIALLGSVAAPQIGSYLGLSSRNDPVATMRHWRIIFGIAAAVSLVSAVIYAIWGSGERQNWIKLAEGRPEQEEGEEDEEEARGLLGEQECDRSDSRTVEQQNEDSELQQINAESYDNDARSASDDNLQRN